MASSRVFSKLTACVLVFLMVGDTMAHDDRILAEAGSIAKPPIDEAHLQEGLMAGNKIIGNIVTALTGNQTSPPAQNVPNLPSPNSPFPPPGIGRIPPTPGTLLPPGAAPTGSGLAPAPGLSPEDPYLFGVYQTTGTSLGASVYTGNRTVQYTGLRNSDGSPANLTDLSYIILGARTDILVDTPLGSAATLSDNNGSLVVGYPAISGSNITVGYTLSDYTTGRTVMFNISVPSSRYSSTAGQGRRLLQSSPCSQIADAAAAFCEAISIPDELSTTVLVNYAQEVESFIQDQLANMRAGSVIYVGAYAGASAAAVADAAASVAIVGVEIYAALGTACLVRSGAANALNYADLHPCSPQQGGCDDNGADDSC